MGPKPHQYPVMFAGGEVANVSTPFLHNCETLSMFEALPTICDAMHTDVEPIPIPGLEFEKHADLLSIVSGLDMHCHELADEVHAARVYDLKLGSLRIHELLRLLHAADYLQHRRAVDSCARVIAGRLRGKSRGEMLKVMEIEEAPEFQRLMQRSTTWILPEDSIRRI